MSFVRSVADFRGRLPQLQDVSAIVWYRVVHELPTWALITPATRYDLPRRRYLCAVHRNQKLSMELVMMMLR